MLAMPSTAAVLPQLKGAALLAGSRRINLDEDLVVVLIEVLLDDLLDRQEPDDLRLVLDEDRFVRRR